MDKKTARTKWLCVPLASRSVFQLLDDAALVRVFWAMADYAEFGTEPEGLNEAEKVVFESQRSAIDSKVKATISHREAGKKGGRLKESQMEPNEAKWNQMEPNGFSSQLEIAKINESAEDFSASSKPNETKQNQNNQMVFTLPSSPPHTPSYYLSHSCSTTPRKDILGTEDIPFTSLKEKKSMSFSNENNIQKRETAEPQKRARSAFVKPTVEELKAYFAEKGKSKGMTQAVADEQAEAFLNYYEANGWHVGKAKMQSWRAAVSNWIRQDYWRKPSYQQKTQEKGLPTDDAYNVEILWEDETT